MVTEKGAKIARLLDTLTVMGNRASVIMVTEMVAQLAESVDDETWARALRAGLLKAGYNAAQGAT